MKEQTFNEVEKTVEEVMDKMERKYKEEKPMKKSEKTLFTVIGKETEDGRVEVTSSISKEMVAQTLELLLTYGEAETKVQDNAVDAEKWSIRNKCSSDLVKKAISFLR